MDDDSFDIVLVLATVSDDESEWIFFDSARREFVLSPTEETAPGTYPIQVILDDSKVKEEYFYNFEVLSLQAPEEEEGGADPTEGDGDSQQGEDGEETPDDPEGSETEKYPDSTKIEVTDLESEASGESDFDPNALWSKESVYG